MAGTKRDPVSEAELTAAIETLRAYRDNKATYKAAVAANKTISRSIRELEHDVAAEKKRLKGSGVDVDKEFEKLLKGGA